MFLIESLVSSLSGCCTEMHSLSVSSEIPTTGIVTREDKISIVGTDELLVWFGANNVCSSNRDIFQAWIVGCVIVHAQKKLMEEVAMDNIGFNPRGPGSNARSACSMPN